jgi:hypothetical protein
MRFKEITAPGVTAARSGKNGNEKTRGRFPGAGYIF